MIINTLSNLNSFSASQIDKFREILLSAAQVGDNTFDGLAAKNPKILFIDNLENPKGIGALKIPHDTYKEKVFRLSESDLDPDLFQYELGWVVSLEKGCGNTIMGLLVDNNYSIYATVRKDNAPMICLLKRYHFTQQGIPYLSERDDYELLLFAR